MTREQIESASGRELDAMVAVSVFRWRLSSHPSDLEIARAAADGSEPQPGPWWVPPGWKEEFATLDLPHYSRDWAGLGLVVDEMRRRGWSWAISMMGQYGAICEFWKEYALDLHAECTNDLPAVAGCRAALLALLAEGANR